MTIMMGGTVCESTDQTDYCKYTRYYHIFGMVTMVIIFMDVVLDGPIIDFIMKRWKKKLLRK